MNRISNAGKRDMLIVLLYFIVFQINFPLNVKDNISNFQLRCAFTSRFYLDKI